MGTIEEIQAFKILIWGNKEGDQNRLQTRINFRAFSDMHEFKHGIETNVQLLKSS